MPRNTNNATLTNENDVPAVTSADETKAAEDARIAALYGNAEAARAALADALEYLTHVEYSGNGAAALASLIYAIDADTRLHAINSVSATGDDVTGPYKSTVRLAGMTFKIVKDAATGRVNVTRDDVNVTDREGISVKVTQYQQERKSVPDAYTVIALNAGRQALELAKQATLKREPSNVKERAPRNGASAKVDALAGQMTELQNMLAQLVAAQAAATGSDN
jgi:hypothetical protein